MGPDLLDFECPRCARTASEPTYGPCRQCRQDLRARFEGEGRQIEVARYEPKVNVVANQVATKD